MIDGGENTCACRTPSPGEEWFYSLLGAYRPPGRETSWGGARGGGWRTRWAFALQRCLRASARRALGVSLVLGLASVSKAKLPEPDVIYWGPVTHSGGLPLTGNAEGQIVVVARLNGIEIGRAALPNGGSQYTLKVPRDDGLAPRIPGTVRSGDRVRVYLINTGTNVEAEARVSVDAAGLTIGGERGYVEKVPLATDIALDAERGLLAGYNQWKLAFLAHGLSATRDDSAEDLDRDGTNNLSEYIAGTDPTDLGSYLTIRDLRARSGVLSVRFGPVRLSRRYTLEAASTPSGPWVPLGTHRFSAAAAEASVDLLQSAVPGRFFRVRVEIE